VLTARLHNHGSQMMHVEEPMNKNYLSLSPIARVGLSVALTAGSMLFAQSPGMPGQQQQQPQNTQPGNNPQAPGRDQMGQQDMSAENAAMAGGDKLFVSKTLEGGMAEVQLGQLAAQKSQSDDVNQFGQKMVADHTQMGDQMKPIAEQLGVVPPSQTSKKDRKEMEKLQGLSGQDFDRAYITMMVTDHRKDLKEFKEEAQTARDPKLKDAVTQGVNVVSQHLQMIEQIAKAHNIDVGGSNMAAVQ
jgi:putative membrane protein